MTWSTGGIITAAKLPRTCIASRTGITIPNSSNTAIGSLSAEYDPGGWIAAGLLRVPIDGIYLVSCQVDFVGMAANKRSIVYFADAIQDTGNSGGTTGSAHFKQVATAVTELAANANVSLTVWHNSGASLTGCAVRLSATLLHPA